NSRPSSDPSSSGTISKPARKSGRSASPRQPDRIMADVRPPYRIPLLVLGFASLIIGVGAGLLRLGWAVPRPAAELAAFHGPLMVSGFFGTVISLERAVALAQRWAYLGPLAAGAGGL